MKRILALILGLAAIPAFAEVDPAAREELDVIRRGKNHPTLQIQDLRVKSSATVGGDMVVSGTVSQGATTSSGAVGATGFKIGATAGFTGVITNGLGLAYTNRYFITGGIITNVLITGP